MCVVFILFIKVWLCSDTLTELVTILMELYNSETLKTFLEDINLSSNDKQRSTSSNTDNIKDDTLLLFNENKATDDQQLIVFSFFPIFVYIFYLLRGKWSRL